MTGIQAPTPVVVPATASITCNQMQAEKIVIEAYGDDGHGNCKFAGSSILSYYMDDGNGGKIFARTPTAAKLVSNLSVTNLFAQATKRALTGNMLLADAINGLMSAIQNEFTLQQQEAAAVASAQAALTAAQTQLATDQTANADPSVLAADQTAINAAQSALTAAQQQAAQAIS